MKKRGQRIRRSVMSAAGVALGLSVAAWITSLFNVGWVFSSSGSMIGLGGGCLGVVGPRPEMPQDPGSYTLGYSWELWWLPTILQPWGIAVPLWMPGIVAATAFGWAWSAGVRAKRRERVGLCPTCGYDLTGIGGVCPECGNPT